MAKKIISMNVDCSVYGKFCKYCKGEGLIMSKQIENFMKHMLEERKK